jgi:hypothetical protein
VAPLTNKRKSYLTIRRVKVKPNKVNNNNNSDRNYSSPFPIKQIYRLTKLNGSVTQRKLAKRPCLANSTQATVISTSSLIASLK